jgi:hypothetical protein
MMGHTAPGAPNGTGNCLFSYSRAANVIQLLNDSDTGWSSPATVGAGGGTLSNSQCTLNAGASSASGSGTQCTLNVSLSFATSYSGTFNMYLRAADMAGNEAPWAAKGSWTVGGNQAPTVTSLTPSSGSVATQSFTSVSSDANGFADIAAVDFLIAPSAGIYSNSCYVTWSKSNNEVRLLSDSGSAWVGSSLIGSGAPLSNSQCTLTATASSTSGSGNNRTVVFNLTFQPAFAGSKYLYLLAYDAVTHSGWWQLGTWYRRSPRIPSRPAGTSGTGTGISLRGIPW